VLVDLSGAGATGVAGASVVGADDACAALPVGSGAGDAAEAGGSFVGIAADGGSLANDCAFSSPACCLSKAAAAKATKNKANILIK